MRPNRKKGALFIAAGLLAVLFATLSDYLRQREISFGNAQIALLALGVLLTLAGLIMTFRRDITLKDLGAFFNNTAHMKTLGDILLYALILLLLVHPLIYLYNWVSYPYPVNYRDVGEVLPAVAMADGINPYALESYPEYMFVYGILFEFIMLPFIGLTDQPLLVAHWTMLVFLAAFLVLAFRFLRQRKASVPAALIGVLVFLNAVCFLWHLDGIRPDTLALFFGYAAFYIFFKKKISVFDLILSSLFCVFCFYLKQYLLFSAAVIVLTLFLFHSKLKSLLYVLFTALFGIGSFLLICHYFPMYYNYALIHHLNMFGGNSTKHMLMQTRDFFLYFWPLVFFALIILYKKLFAFDFKAVFKRSSYTLRFTSPLITGYRMDFWIIGLVGAAAVLTFWLGHHGLSYYSYYVELLLPYLVFLVIPELEPLLPKYTQRFLALLFIMGFCLLPFRARYVLNARVASMGYQQLFGFAEQCANIYDTNPLAAVYKLNRDIRPIYNNGQTEYAPSVFSRDAGFMGKFSIIADEQIEERLTAWNQSIEQGLHDQEFDCIIAQTTDPFANYEINEVLEVPGSPLFIFKPTTK